MKQAATDKYSIAWFKLADCVARGEKERALGVFRLLAHSIDDNALTQQLYGDILLSFDDAAGAQARYIKAAEMYAEDERFLEAAAVYEHLISLQPDVITYREKLIGLYQSLSIVSKVCEYVDQLVTHLLGANDWQKAIEVARMYDSAGDMEFVAKLHEKLVFTLVTIPDVLPDTIMIHVKKVIDAWHSVEDIQAVKNFLQQLQAIDKKLYEQAKKYVH